MQLTAAAPIAYFPCSLWRSGKEATDRDATPDLAHAGKASDMKRRRPILRRIGARCACRSGRCGHRVRTVGEAGGRLPRRHMLHQVVRVRRTSMCGDTASSKRVERVFATLERARRGLGASTWPQASRDVAGPRWARTFPIRLRRYSLLDHDGTRARFMVVGSSALLLGATSANSNGARTDRSCR